MLLKVISEFFVELIFGGLKVSNIVSNIVIKMVVMLSVMTEIEFMATGDYSLCRLTALFIRTLRI